MKIIDEIVEEIKEDANLAWHDECNSIREVLQTQETINPLRIVWNFVLHFFDHMCCVLTMYL